MSDIVWHPVVDGEQEVIMEVQDTSLRSKHEQADVADKDSGYSQVSPSTSSQQTQRPVSQDSTALSVGPVTVSVGGGGLQYASPNLENDVKFENQKLCATPGGRSASSMAENSAGTLTYHGLTYRIETVTGCFKRVKNHKCIVNNIRYVTVH